jgi:uncharacterized protein (TIGR02284 family)
MQDYSALKEVLSICRDAELGFRGAANAVKTPILKSLFEEYSVQRGAFANDLNRTAREMGLDITNPSGVGGVLHAGWMELKGALTGHSEHQILVETARGEELSLRKYREALAMTLTDDVRTLIQQQQAEIQRAHDRIVSLRDSTAAPHTAPEQTRGAR